MSDFVDMVSDFFFLSNDDIKRRLSSFSDDELYRLYELAFPKRNTPLWRDIYDFVRIEQWQRKYPLKGSIEKKKGV